MAEKVEAFLVAYSSQERANSAPEFRNCALGGLSEERFEFAENLLDRVEIRRIRWQIERGRTHSLDRVRHTGYLMSRKVVHDDDVTVVERLEPDIVRRMRGRSSRSSAHRSRTVRPSRRGAVRQPG